MSLLQSIASTAASKAGAALVGTAFAVASVGAASATGLLPELASTETSVVEEPTEEPTLQEEPDTGEEPIVEEEESVVDEPIVEEEPGTEEEPDSGEEPVLEEQEPIVEDEPGTEEEPVVEEDESVVKAPNPVSQVVGVHQGDPGFGQAVSDAARKGGLGQQVSQIAKNQHRGGETVTDGEDVEVEAAESTSSKADKPGKGKGRSGR